VLLKGQTKNKETSENKPTIRKKDKRINNEETTTKNFR
jgi:hypothetical protein